MRRFVSGLIGHGFRTAFLTDRNKIEISLDDSKTIMTTGKNYMENITSEGWVTTVLRHYEHCERVAKEMLGEVPDLAKYVDIFEKKTDF